MQKAKNGASMPLIGLGTSKDDPSLIEGATRSALEAGYRMIDTATFYNNEAEIGRALKAAFRDGLLTREELYVVTKVPPIGARRVRHFLRKSLSLLDLDYVDLYLIHQPVPFLYGKDDSDLLPIVDGKFQYDMETHIMDTWQDMESCVDEGLCRHIGLSNCNAQQLLEVCGKARIRPHNLQVECHLHLQEPQLVELCKRQGVTVTAYAPLGSPAYGRFLNDVLGITHGTENFTPILEEPVLKALADKYNKSPAQVALRWMTQRGIVPIPKSIQENRIRENIQIFDFTLNKEEMEEIMKCDRNLRMFHYRNICPGIENHPLYPFN